MEEYISDLDESKFEDLCLPILKRKPNCQIDTVAMSSIPPDSPPYVLPVYTTGDGNCFPRSISQALFGNENCHLEIQLRILIEGVKNKSKYLDDNFLKNAATHLHSRGTFPQQYAIFSGQYFPPSDHLDEIVEMY